ncbi:MAG: hypothetical protein OCD01_07140 [Fibrobacterales bacterium]
MKQVLAFTLLFTHLLFSFGGAVEEVFYLCTDIDETHIESSHTTCESHNEVNASESDVTFHPVEEHCIDITLVPKAEQIDASLAEYVSIFIPHTVVQWHVLVQPNLNNQMSPVLKFIERRRRVAQRATVIILC